jgi:mRNA-degrading endonuclease toxin of MazEF toxin-antitoxin module
MIRAKAARHVNANSRFDKNSKTKAVTTTIAKVNKKRERIMILSLFLLMVIPLSSSVGVSRFAFTVEIEPSELNALTLTSVAMIFQLRAIDRRRIVKKIGRLEPEILAQIDGKIWQLLKPADDRSIINSNENDCSVWVLSSSVSHAISTRSILRYNSEPLRGQANRQLPTYNCICYRRFISLI